MPLWVGQEVLAICIPSQQFASLYMQLEWTNRSCGFRQIQREIIKRGPQQPNLCWAVRRSKSNWCNLKVKVVLCKQCKFVGYCYITALSPWEECIWIHSVLEVHFPAKVGPWFIITMCFEYRNDYYRDNSDTWLFDTLMGIPLLLSKCYIYIYWISPRFPNISLFGTGIECIYFAYLFRVAWLWLEKSQDDEPTKLWMAKTKQTRIRSNILGMVSIHSSHGIHDLCNYDIPFSSHFHLHLLFYQTPVSFQLGNAFIS